MTLDLTKRRPELIKDVIFEIAKNNGSAIVGIFHTLSAIEKYKKLRPQTVYNQIDFLKDCGLLESRSIETVKKRWQGEQKDAHERFVNFKQNIETFKEIAKILGNKELSRLMVSKYYQDNVKEYLTNLINSMEQNKLYQLPEIDYFAYALRNSPSTVRFFLIDNDINFLISFHKRIISLSNKNLKDTIVNKSLQEVIKLEMIDEFKYPFWDQVIWGKIQEDALNKILLNPNNYFADYLPTFKNVIDTIDEIINTPEAKKFLDILKEMVKEE